MPGRFSGEDHAQYLNRCYRWEGRLSQSQARTCAVIAMLWSSLMSDLAPGDVHRVIDPLAFAIEALEEHDPDSDLLNDIRLTMVAKLISYDRIENARHYYRALIDSLNRLGRPADTKGFRAYFHMCGAAVREDHLTEAETCFEQGIAFLESVSGTMAPEEASALMAIGVQQLAFAKSRLAKAEEVLTLVRALREGADAGATIERGSRTIWAILEAKSYLTLDQPAKALDILDRADGEEPGRFRVPPYLVASISGFRAIALTTLGRLAEAEEAFGEATAIYETLPPEHAQDRYVIYTSFANALYLRGQPERALEIARAALDIRREPLTFQIIALALIDLDRIDEAVIAARTAMREIPRDRPMAAVQVATVTIDLAAIESMRGNVGVAQQLLDGVELPPDAPAYIRGNRLLVQADLLAARGETDRAIRMAREGVDIIEANLPEDHPQLVWGRLQLALMLGAEGAAQSYGLLKTTQEALLRRIEAYSAFGSAAQTEIREYRPLFTTRVQIAWALAGAGN